MLPFYVYLSNFKTLFDEKLEGRPSIKNSYATGNEILNKTRRTENRSERKIIKNKKEIEEVFT